MVTKMVLTGGPCAGKTSCLRAIRARFGERVVTVPEAATLLLDSGFPSPGHERIRARRLEWIRAFQREILSLQQIIEDKWERLAHNCGARLLVCDRGLLDGAAYWPEGRQGFLSYFGLSLEQCFERYHTVYHLQSLAASHPHLYGTRDNPIRYEDATEALQVERSVRNAWDGHPNVVVFSPEAEPQAKIDRLLEHLQQSLATS
jgi:predicted ATPase